MELSYHHIGYSMLSIVNGVFVIVSEFSLIVATIVSEFVVVAFDPVSSF